MDGVYDEENYCNRKPEGRKKPQMKERDDISEKGGSKDSPFFIANYGK